MSKKSCKKICKRCGKEFEAESGYVKYCDDCLLEIKKERQKKQNELDFQKRQKKLLTGVEGIDYIIDRWNGLPTKTIGGKWMEVQHPGRTLDEYKEEFPDAPIVCSSTSSKISDNMKEFMNTPENKKFYSEKMKGDKNPNAKCNTTEEQRKSVSPFSKSFKKYDGLSDYEKENEISKCLKLGSKDRTTSQVGYWIKKGYSEEEAKSIVTERQKTFTLEKCIEKYGLEEGYNRWKTRQEKWSSNIEQQYRDGKFSKIPHSTNTSMYSNSERKFVDELIESNVLDYQQIKCYKTKQIELINQDNECCSNRKFLYDFAYENKIIEFNGDFWHMNPKIYDENYYNKISKIDAKSKWEYDKQKIKCAESYGYEVLVIWESDYYQNREQTIQRCIEFLTKNSPM